MKAGSDMLNDVKETGGTSKLVVVADLGRLRAFRLDESPAFSRPRLRLIEDWETGGTRRISEELTDQAGRFRKEPAVTGALSDGEEHNLDLERRNRTVKKLAETIGDLILREDVEACYLAADERINKSILEQMDPGIRAQIQRNLTVNLSKLSADQIIDQFSGKERHAPQ